MTETALPTFFSAVIIDLKLKNDILYYCRILWNLEESQGSSVTVNEVYDHYADYCTKNNIEAATSVAFGRTMYALFSTVRNVDRNRKRTYVNMRYYPNPTNQICDIPEHCTVNQSVEFLTIYVPTEFVRNNESIQWQLQFAHDKVRAFCAGSEVCLEALGISAYAPLQGRYVSAAINAIQQVKICKGAEWYEELGEEPEIWHQLQDENTLMKTIKSPSCAGFMSPLVKKQVCHNCSQFIYKKQLKRKRQDSAKEEEFTADSEVCSTEFNHPSTENFENLVRKILPNAPEGLTTLMKSQFRNNDVNNKKDPRHRRWDPEVISMALSIWCRSPRAYSALKESGMLVLPSDRLLR